MESKGFSKLRLQRMHDVLAGFVDRGEIPGMVTLVSRKGEVHVEELGKHAINGNRPMRRDTIFRIASMTKPITAVAAMILVEQCKLRLDEPLDRFLPELANHKVLRSLESPLEDFVPANRSITLRDLLTFRLGIGAVMAPPDTYPIQRAMDEAGLSPGPNPPTLPSDEWMKRLGKLPFIYQPGETWMYHTGSDILGIVIERASGQKLEDFFRACIFEPLGMKDTSFYVPLEKLDRLPPSYMRDHGTGDLIVQDDPDHSRWGSMPAFQSGGGGLVSTVDDYLAFCQMMVNKGSHGRERILSRASVELMTADHLTIAQKASARIFFGDSSSWGFGVGVNIQRDDLFLVPGRFGWDGGIGTSGYSDPAEDMIGILMTQRLMDSPAPPNIFSDFWTLAYQAIND
ncbi:serine hydrolase domain-containing protein [Brevibacillus sp. SIMBA_040]|uniref:serine hydrolase domain-containing protein n=1 Tax=unclassified Brevibacillus TaxID=2684853 RepID=UPI00397B8AEF